MITLNLEAYEKVRGNHDWAWELRFSHSRDDEALYSFIIKDWSYEEGVVPDRYHGTAYSPQKALDKALEMYEKNRKAMG